MPKLKLLGSNAAMAVGWLLLDAHYQDFNGLRYRRNMEDFGITEIPRSIKKKKQEHFLKNLLF